MFLCWRNGVRSPMRGAHSRWLAIAAASATAFAAPLLAVPFGIPQALAQRGRSTPLPLPALLDATYFGLFQPVSLSPDGTKLLHTRCDPRRTGLGVDGRMPGRKVKAANQYGMGCDVFVTEVASGASTNLTTTRGSNWGPSWSPSGAEVAFLSDRNGTARLYIGTLTGRNRGLVPAKPYQVPQWLDSRRIILLAPAARSPTDVATASSGSARSTPDSRTVTVYRSRLNDSARAGVGADGGPPPPWSLEPKRSSMVVVDVRTGHRRTIEAHALLGSDNQLDPFAAVAPNGRSIAYTIGRGFSGSGTFQQLFDLVVATVDDSITRRVVARQVPQLFGADISWSSDGRYLAWFTSGPSDRGDVYVYDMRTATSHLVTSAPHPRFNAISGDLFSAPIWLDDHTIIAKVFEGPQQTQFELAKANALWTIDVATGTVRRLVALPDGEIVRILSRPPSRVALRSGSGAVVAMKLRNQQQGLYAIDLSTGRRRPILEGPFNIGYATGWDSPVGSRDGRMAVYIRQSAAEAPDVWAVTLSNRKQQRITRLNPLFDTIPLGKGLILSYRGPDGAILRSALLLPPGWLRSRRVPLIVYPYGSWDLSWLVGNFGFAKVAAGGTENMQALATRGYGILVPDAPVRTGRPMVDIARTVLAGVDEAIRRGYADSNHVGVMGFSYGGYSVYSLIAQTDRFRAAVVVAGFSDWVAFYSMMRADGSNFGITQTEERQYGLGGTPWQVRERFVTNSPFYAFDRVSTPTLIIHGTDDVIDDFNARMSFVGLRRLGKDVSLALYKGEGHSPLTWRYSNQLDYLQRIIGWFDRYLCPGRVSPAACTV
jgi:dipeptidyl aminopeptidase/acylaminoacyl peptidase